MVLYACGVREYDLDTFAFCDGIKKTEQGNHDCEQTWISFKVNAKSWDFIGCSAARLFPAAAVRSDSLANNAIH